MAALSFVVRASLRNGELFIPEEAHTYIKLFVLVATVHHLAQGIEYMRAPVVSDIHGYAQNVAHITRIAGEEPDTFHGKVHTHQRMFITFFGDDTDWPLKRNPPAYTSVMHHIFHVPGNRHGVPTTPPSIECC